MDNAGPSDADKVNALDHSLNISLMRLTTTADPIETPCKVTAAS